MKILKFIPLLLILISIAIITVLYKNREYKFTPINVNKYIELLNTDKALIYIVSDTCQISTQTTPIIKKTFKGSNIDIYMLNTSKLSDEEKSTFIQAHTITSTTNSYATPMLIYVNDKSIKDSIIGIFTEDNIIQFVSRNKIVE